MIGKLTGRVDYRAEDHILLDVQGVGYVVYCSERTLMALPRSSEVISLYTDLLVREDLLQLFGFTSLVEKEWHRLLMSVQGVGAKASLAILGTLGPDGVSRAIALEDWNAVKAAKGIGPKTAQRVVLDLKDKAPSVMAMAVQFGDTLDMHQDQVVDDADTATVSPQPAPNKKATPKPRPASAAAQSEALSALQNLGYSPSEAASAVATAQGELPDAGTSDLIRAALKLLAPKD